MVAKLQESLQATVTLHQKATKDSNQINMLSVSLADPHRFDPDLDFHVDADSDPDIDCHQNNADPHTDPTASLRHVGKQILYTICHSIATTVSFTHVGKQILYTICHSIATLCTLFYLSH